MNESDFKNMKMIWKNYPGPSLRRIVVVYTVLIKGYDNYVKDMTITSLYRFTKFNLKIADIVMLICREISSIK